MYFPESSLWTRARINDEVVANDDSGNFFLDFTSDQTKKAKMDSMNIDANLQMDFMSNTKIQSFLLIQWITI